MSKEYVYADARWTARFLRFFGSSVRPRLMELCISKDDLLVPGTAHRQNVALASQASNARLSDSRRRPPAARRDRQGIADVILWRQFRSGPVIIVVKVERGFGASCFVPCLLLGRAKRARAAQSEKERPHCRLGWTDEVRVWVRRYTCTCIVMAGTYPTAPS